MIILGINNMHDASAVLAVDGRIVAAAEEERFCRKKHVSGLPVNAIRFCLDYSGVNARDIDHICASWKPWILRIRVTQALKSVLTSPNIFRAKVSRGAGQMRHEWSELFRLRKLIRKHLGHADDRIAYIDHHLSHAASSFLCSPFDKAAILTIDGAGESDTTVLWTGEGSRIRKLKSVRLPHSIGHFYSSITAFLGFRIRFDEYKIMALAAYGEPEYADYLRKHFLKLLPDGTFRINPYFIDYHLARNRQFRKITTDILGKPRAPGEELTRQHANIAASAQLIIEECLFHMLNRIYEVSGMDNLCLAGGVTFNSVANGKIYMKGPFKNIFLQPAAGDAGSAMGAALYQTHNKSGIDRQYVLENAFLGPSYDNSYCEKLLDARGIPFDNLPEETLLKKTAQLLAEGKLICWYHGRMEWGPRALGARSLLADPRNPGIKDLINNKIKKREYFRPFGPSVLSEHAADIFEDYCFSPFMLFAFPVKKDVAKKIPAVVHVDNTARPQAVSKEINPRYWGLIKEFQQLTGVPLILNTSFNVQEPIVCSPEDALKTFLETSADYLVLENCLVKLPVKE